MLSGRCCGTSLIGECMEQGAQQAPEVVEDQAELYPAPHSSALVASPRVTGEEVPIEPASDFMWPITGSMALRRRARGGSLASCHGAGRR